MRLALPVVSLTVLLTVSPAAIASEKAETGPTIPLRVKDWKGVQNLVAEQKGKVVVVDIWTTTCLTCVEELPEFVALRKKFGKDRIALVSVNCDYDGIEGKPPEYYRERVQKVLADSKAAHVQNVLLNVPFIDFLDQIDVGSSPCLYVYGPDGQLARRFDNDDAVKIEDEFTMQQVEALIEKIVPKKNDQ